MLQAAPGSTITISQSGIPTGQVVGVQVQKAATGSIAVGRFTAGVVERPDGTGNYVATFTVPAEPDLYLIVLDWNGGVLTSTKSLVEELQVSALVAIEDTGLGAVADYVRLYLGGSTFQGLLDSTDFGSGSVAAAIEVVKARVMATPPDTASEDTLPVLVLSYLAKLAALELIPAARALWASIPQATSTGNDPAESVSYGSREQMLGDLADDLLRQARADQALALSLIDGVVLPSTTSGPAIDEVDDDVDRHVTRDPRCFPREREFPLPIGTAGWR